MQRTYKINSLWSYECERCHRSFPDEEALEEHWKTVHVVGDN